MKKHLTILLLALFSKGMVAQFVYSTVWSDFSPTYTLTSGFSTTTSPGYIWCGYHPQLNLGNYPWWPQNLNIMIRGYGVSSLWASYKLYEGNSTNCTGPLTQILNGRGVSMVEVSYQFANGQVPVGPVRYAMAGAYDKGCYFLGVTSVGTPSAAMLYPFPAPQAPNQSLPGKPVLVQDNSSTDFYIAGSFNGALYLLRVDINGNLIWSRNYSLNGDASSRDLLIYPGPSPKLLVAGTVQNALGDQDGFLMTIDPANGNANNLREFGNPGFNDGFNTIMLAAPSGPGAPLHLICGGFTQNSQSVSESWLLETDLSGNVYWTSRPQPASGLNYAIVDILCRENTWQVFEYYALVHSASGMVVLKLDVNGQAFQPSPLAPNNEYVYNLPGTTPSLPAAISMVNSPTNGPNLGIQVFGTANNISTAATSHVVEAYFNGVNGCYNILQLQNNPQAHPVNSVPAAYLNSQGLTACSNFSAAVLYPGGAMNFVCPGYYVNGDNSRNIATQLREMAAEGGQISLQPNPASDRTELIFSAGSEDLAELVISDLLGHTLQHKTIPCTYSGTYREPINLTDFKRGVYFIDLYLNGTKQQNKLVVAE